MENKVVTHWINELDWKTVIENAYSNDEEANRKSLSSIVAWESRDSNLQAAIVCLKELLLAKLCQNDKQTQVYQYNLCLSIIRFVNFITEPYQKSLFAKPIKTIANELGIPDWIVNIRHNATHFSLPSVEILEEARDFLFKWLKERYVDTYKEYTIEKTVLNNVQIEIEKTLKEYIDLRRKTKLKKGKNKKKKRDYVQTDQYINEKLEVFMKSFKSQTFDVLISDGFMIPTKEQLASYGIFSEEFFEQEIIELPSSVWGVWELFLDYCSKNDLIAHLFNSLIKCYKNKNENNNMQSGLRNRFLLGWILRLVKLRATKGNSYYFEADWKDILLNVLQSNPNIYTYLFLKEISHVQSIRNQISYHKLEKLQKLVHYLCFVNSVNGNSANSVNSKEDFKSINDYEPLRLQNTENAKINNNNNNNKNSKIDSIWKLIDDDDWNRDNLKLGLVDCQTYSSLNLDIGKILGYENIEKHKVENLGAIQDESSSKKRKASIYSDENIEQLKTSVLLKYWKISS